LEEEATAKTITKRHTHAKHATAANAHIHATALNGARVLPYHRVAREAAVRYLSARVAGQVDGSTVLHAHV
jgi:hypothetical protein